MLKFKKVSTTCLLLMFAAVAAIGCTNAQKKPLPNQNRNQQMAPNQNEQINPMVPNTPNRGLDGNKIPGDMDDRR